MDAVKIIKKHGSPGGVPTITAYVDENAPGEAQATSLYLHQIKASNYIFHLYSSSDTPFTTGTFAAWLKNNGFNSNTKLFSCVVPASVPSVSSGQVQYYLLKGAYSTNGTVTSLRVKGYKLSVSSNTLSITESSDSDQSITVSSDTVTKVI